MSDSRFTNSEIILTDTFQSRGPQLERINKTLLAFQKNVGFAIKQSGVMEIQRQIGFAVKQSGVTEIQRQIGFAVKQSGVTEIQRQIGFAVKQSGVTEIQRQIGFAIKQSGVMEIQRQIGIAIKQSGLMEIQRQIQERFGHLVDRFDWDEFMDIAEEKERARLDEESNRLRGLLSREYQSINALVLQLQAFFETLKKKSPTLFLILSILVWKPITDSLSDAIRDVTRIIITNADHVTFKDKNILPKTFRKEAAVELRGVEPLFVGAIRIIIKPELELRAQATRQSKVVTTLVLGQKVRFIEKRGDWTQIEAYDAATDTHHSGWVYTRYLAKVEK
ncbi:SH3 domain-containing protein [Paenibacillus sp. Y412MC10]|uniref:SH3 domain-containing protein n=1 Tax=Geobacillus sp. (strain Y412MC10) TaxID=481743 RepID=UPI0011AB3BC6|nr:SH3 domain-containing protein [Paenibacillus sp. Y412MC10]